ncbi:MAG TPA: glycosyltransferase family 2 protein [Acidimicrobiales bacterium]|nr:glycosyltransferase family 2 protein [Acidimicrobiales bacterium]
MAAMNALGGDADPVSKQHRLCVVVPAFNEARSVFDVVQMIYSSLPHAHVVVVNDGSTDETAMQAYLAGAAVVSLPINLGIGGAVQTGYQYALRHGFEYAMQIDGDGQHDPAEAARLLGPLFDGTADLTIGSRWLGRGAFDSPTGRRFGMRILAMLVRWKTGGSFTDTTSGFRAVGRRGIELFASSYPTDFPEVGTIVLACHSGLTVAEVPVQMEPRRHGRSSIAGLGSAYYMVRVVVDLLVDGARRRSVA